MNTSWGLGSPRGVCGGRGSSAHAHTGHDTAAGALAARMQDTHDRVCPAFGYLMNNMRRPPALYGEANVCCQPLPLTACVRPCRGAWQRGWGGEGNDRRPQGGVARARSTPAARGTTALLLVPVWWGAISAGVSLRGFSRASHTTREGIPSHPRCAAHARARTRPCRARSASCRPRPGRRTSAQAQEAGETA